ncbi:replication protein, partial [Rodentibacter caecimuris]|uniref:replication protein n=1 Tax=Rodentibacter caecimuris TaxID=1796644 RepID=UPI00211A15A0
MMSNVVRIEVLRDLKATKEKQEQQGAKKVSVEEGFTAIPNELLFAMGRFGFTQRQFSVLMAVIQKTLSWHKEMDWISNSQLCELTGIKGEHKVSAVKNELFQMNVLIKKGRSFGLNLVVSEWEKSNLPEKGNLTQKGKSNLPEKGNRIYPNQVTTKETIPKEKINTPIIPQGENLPDGKYLAKSPRRVGEKINFDQIAECWNSENENRG